MPRFGPIRWISVGYRSSPSQLDPATSYRLFFFDSTKNVARIQPEYTDCGFRDFSKVRPASRSGSSGA
ncbi:MAG: hypothetical protein CMJ81_00670 [Planctomycetaceae bacterium]|nr:hypothetical protein [Planctomycetaceae bacterium]MBP63940.1 hypothetical protein [Planctomycetaceae bacterium]